MSDDLFSQLFELFNQPGPVNLKLAAEMARHLAGEREPIDPWVAEEFRELTRLAEFRGEQTTPFPVPAASDVLPVDGREWAERNLEGFAYLVEPFAGMIDLEHAGPAAEMLRPLGPALVGIQVGTLVGSLSRWVMSSFDTGVPVAGGGPVSFVVPTIDRFAGAHGFDGREVRLWAALNETIHRALFRIPFVSEHLAGLLQGYAETLRLSPDRLMEMMQGFDPSNLEGMDPSRVADLFDSPETRETQAELAAFIGLASGYRRLLVERAAAELLPRLGEMNGARDGDRALDEHAVGSAFAVTFVEAATIEKGHRFCLEVERRYGAEQLSRMWTREGRLPRAAEMDDPVAWAARVLLDELEG